ncbi:MAG: hypothetical protein LBR20_08880 [Propionibacteriaceae bacterium]|nr:hypothetical protein [Propionibacteriaceae bacterium]
MATGVAWGLFTLFAIPLAIIDALTARLPNLLMYPALGCSLAWVLLSSSLIVPPASFWAVASPALAGSLIGGLTLLFVWYSGKRRARSRTGDRDALSPLGFGDVRLGFLLGIPTGLLGTMYPVIALLVGSVFAVGYGLARKPASGYPFGPFLILGAYLAGAVALAVDFLS